MSRRRGRTVRPLNKDEWGDYECSFERPTNVIGTRFGVGVITLMVPRQRDQVPLPNTRPALA